MTDAQPPNSTRRARLRTWGACGLAAVAAGLAGAVFLHALGWVTGLHRSHPVLLFALPALGVGIWWLYARYAGAAARGTNLLIEAAHDPNVHVPFKLAPLVLIGTLLTHLGGGSAGREGTAVQMGGGIGGGIADAFRLEASGRRLLLLAGMAACFGAVFGTPWAAALFAIECTRPSRADWRALPACIVAAWIGHGTSVACLAHHAVFNVRLPAAEPLFLGVLSWRWIGMAVLTGVAAGAIARLYVWAGRGAALAFGLIRQGWARPVAGAALLILLTKALGSRASLGLGAESVDPGDASIAAAFGDGPIGPWAWALKLLFTVLTLGSGFKGGEVTPLFFVGATAGHALAVAAGFPPGLGAAVGLVALFAGASRTPMACTVMGLELFGLGLGPYLAVGCVAALFAAGPDGIYEARNARATSPPSSE